MKTYIPLLICFLLISINLAAQDYFEDSKGSGFSVLSASDGTLISTKLNVGDNSLKLNLFQLYPLKDTTYKDQKKHDSVEKSFDFGWGVSLKGKTVNGLGVLFSSGSFAPGFNGSGYIALRKIIEKKNNPKHHPTSWWLLMLSGGYSMSKLNLYNPDVGFSKQLSDTNFQGFNAGLSWCYLFPVNKGKDDLILGASLEIERGNDYANLSKVDIKNVQFASDSAGHERYINSINQNGSIYAQGAYQEYITEQFRVNMAYIPSFLKSKEKNPIAILFYPSVNYSAIFAPMYNFGFGLRFLKKGSPTISIAGLYIEFNDITDAQKKLEGFVKHTITAGLTASLDVPNVK